MSTYFFEKESIRRFFHPFLPFLPCMKKHLIYLFLIYYKTSHSERDTLPPVRHAEPSLIQEERKMKARTSLKSRKTYITMKASLMTLALMAALPTLAGQARLIFLPTTATTAPAATAPAAATPTETTPVAAPPCALTWELGAGYNFATRHLAPGDDELNPKVDTLNIDLTAVYKLAEQHALTLRFGYAGGTDSVTETETWTEGGYTIHESYRVHARVNNFYLMPGYRFTQALTDTVSLFAGANIGVANSSVKIKETWEGSAAGYSGGESYKAHGSEFGLAYSAEIGIRYNITPTWDIFIAYQLFGSTAKPDVDYGDGDVAKTRQQLSHGIRVGIGCQF